MAFNFDVDVNDLVTGFNEATENTSENKKEFEEVPFGTYMVKIDKLFLKPTKTNKPMVRVWFRILEGDQKNRLIFMNQMVDTGQKMNIFKSFLAKLDSGVELGFDGDWDKFEAMLDNIFDEVSESVEYELEYGQNDRGYNTYFVQGAYDAE